MNNRQNQIYLQNKTRPIILLIFLFFSQLPICYSQDENTYRLTNLTDTIITFDIPWKYQAGDDTTWAATDFPDQKWDTLSTTLNMSSVSDSVFPGKGWFRLHLSIDSGLMDKTHILLMNHKGASEIYHNGIRLKRSGRLGINDMEKRYRDPANLPIPIHFNNQEHQVIAVRYVNEDAYKAYKKFRREEAGFTLRITDLATATTSLIGIALGGNIVISLFIIFFVLGGLHLLLFLFFPDNKSNLYYSVFALGLALVIFSSYLEIAFIFRPGFSLAFEYYVELIVPMIFVLLMALVYSLFYEKFPVIFWVIIAMGVVISILNYLDVSWILYALGLFMFLIFFEIFRVIIRAMIKGISGAWIIGTGILFFILFLTLLIIIAIWKGNHVIQGSSFYAIIISLLLLLAVISIPLSMSVYLALDFARTNKNLKTQLENVKVLSAKTIEQEKEKQKILAGQKEKLEVLVKQRTHELEKEKEKTEELLLNTLPLKVVNDLKENGRTEPESFENVTVYFSDIVGFTNISTSLEPAILIGELNEIFTAFDDIMERNQCERIKTIGDAYLAVCGMPDKHENHANLMAKAALEIREYLEERNKQSEISWKIRIGLHSGKVVGGVVGIRKYIYDVFGDTINTTSRMESNSEPMRINVSETTWLLIKDRFSFTPREPMEIKGKGKMKMYFLDE